MRRIFVSPHTLVHLKKNKQIGLFDRQQQNIFAQLTSLEEKFVTI
jgi:hypothetical protein